MSTDSVPLRLWPSSPPLASPGSLRSLLVRRWFDFFFPFFRLASTPLHGSDNSRNTWCPVPSKPATNTARRESLNVCFSMKYRCACGADDASFIWNAITKATIVTSRGRPTVVMLPAVHVLTVTRRTYLHNAVSSCSRNYYWCSQQHLHGSVTVSYTQSDAADE